MQKYPKIIFKLGPLAIITNYDCKLHLVIIKYDTEPERNTFYKTMIIGDRLLGPIHLLHEFHYEILKDSNKDLK